MNRSINKHFFVAFSQLLIALKGLILLPILVKNLELNEYAEFVLIITFLNIIFGLSSLGLDYTYKRALPTINSNKTKGYIFSKQFVLNIITLIFIILILYILRNIIDENLIPNYSAYYNESILFISGIFIWSQCNNYFRFSGRFNLFSLSILIAPYLTIFIIVIFVLFEKGNIQNFLISNTLAYWIMSIPLIFLMFSEIKLTKFKIRLTEIKKDIKTGFPFTINNFLDFILNSSDKFVISYFLGTYAVGLYSPSYSVSLLLAFVPKVLLIILPYDYTKLYEKKQFKNIEENVNKYLTIFITISIPLIFLSIIFSEPLLLFLTNIEIAKSSTKLIPIILTGTIFYGSNLILIPILFTYKLPQILLKSNIIAALLNISLNIVALYFLKDLRVAAISTLISYGMSFLVVYIYIKKILTIKLNLRYIVNSILFGLIMNTSFFLFFSSTSIWIAFLIYLLIYLIFLYFIIKKLF